MDIYTLCPYVCLVSKHEKTDRAGIKQIVLQEGARPVKIATFVG